MGAINNNTIALVIGAGSGIGRAVSLTLQSPTMAVALLVAATVGVVSAFIPAYHASRCNIVEGLRHIG